MDKIQTLLFIALGLGVFVWRMLKQAAETTAREQRERPRRPGSAPTPALPDTSFQELLRQMQRQNQEQPQPPAAPVPPVTPVPPAARSLERKKQRPVSLEAAATARAAAEPEPHARRAATLPRAATVAPITDYWTGKKPAPPTPAASRRRVMEALRNPANLRAAFVLSEILRRPE